MVGTHNYAGIVDSCLKSVAAQTFPFWQCIVVDNGSTDQTLDIVRSAIREDSRFLLHAVANRGPSFGRNAGYLQMQPDVEYVVFLDGDDQLEPDFLAELTKYLDNNPAVGAVGCHYEEIDGSGKVLGRKVRSRWAPGLFGIPCLIPASRPDTPFETFFSVTGNGPFFLFRRSVLSLTGLYDEALWFCEDSDILCRISLASAVHFVPAFLYRKRTHGQNISRHLPRGGEENFRAKWDNPLLHPVSARPRIESALRYYYRRHVPLRDLKIAARNVVGFAASADLARLFAATRLAVNSLKGALGLTLPRSQRP